VGQYLDVRLTSTTGATFRGVRIDPAAAGPVPALPPPVRGVA
jgi:hypothetical protein